MLSEESSSREPAGALDAVQAIKRVPESVDVVIGNSRGESPGDPVEGQVGGLVFLVNSAIDRADVGIEILLAGRQVHSGDDQSTEARGGHGHRLAAVPGQITPAA